MKELLSIIIIFFSITVQSQNLDKPNIIMMIGDGMGISQISSSMYSSNNYTPLERSEFVGLIKTHSLDDLVTDSAASGTALSSGVKTYNGVLGLDQNYNPVKTILEICRDEGYMTAIIVTSTIVHATPAAYYSKSKSRYEYQKIADELLKSNVNFFVGGGEKYFNNRDDKRNLMEEMRNYSFVNSLEDYRNINSKNIGFFTAYDDPIQKNFGREPSLYDIIEATIQKLKNFDNPFFILVEGSQIDWAEHDNDPEYLLSEMLEFDEAIDISYKYAEESKNTLVVVTADHETGGAAIVSGNLEESVVKINYSSEDHTSEMVPVFSIGPYSENFKGVYDNTEIFNKLFEIVKQ
tara:strand:+ start:5974 stop:7023 length:1050 start_codon:yes stop_codon:yes gene_type:complete